MISSLAIIASAADIMDKTSQVALAVIFYGIGLVIPIILLILAWRFVKAHEEIAKSLRASGQAHREAAVALRKLADTQSNKLDNQS